MKTVIAMLALATLAVLPALSGCVENPATGRSSFAFGSSPASEVATGKEAHPEILKEFGGEYPDPAVKTYVDSIGQLLARTVERHDFPYTFTVLNSPVVNAFAVPGGFVYVNRGLIQRTDQMDELAGVLGHEIGHVVRRHTVKQMEKAQGANIGVTLACVLTSICNSQAAGAAINIAGGAVFARFSRSDEAEADAEGVKNTVRAGISPVGMVTMFQKLLEERKARPGAVESWFLTHPLEEDRITAVQSMINAIPPSQLAQLGTDSRNFHAFKSRIQSLPPSPPPRQVQ